MNECMNESINTGYQLKANCSENRHC